MTAYKLFNVLFYKIVCLREKKISNRLIRGLRRCRSIGDTKPCGKNAGNGAAGRMVAIEWRDKGRRITAEKRREEGLMIAIKWRDKERDTNHSGKAARHRKSGKATGRRKSGESSRAMTISQHLRGRCGEGHSRAC